MNKILKYILSIPKTVYFNLKIFDMKRALRFPVIISYDTKIYEIHKNSILIDNDNIERFMIKIGFGGTSIIPNQKASIKLENGSKVIFKGTAFFSEGTCIYVEKDANIIFGNNVASNKNCIYHSCEEIEIGENALIGWNVNFRDNDGHTVFHMGEEQRNREKIFVENNVWIGSYVDLLKGVVISKNSIVATRSCVTKKFEKENILIGGYPAKVIKEEISWKK